jgi:hypothetical protein
MARESFEQLLAKTTDKAEQRQLAFLWEEFQLLRCEDEFVTGDLGEVSLASCL